MNLLHDPRHRPAIVALLQRLADPRYSAVLTANGSGLAYRLRDEYGFIGKVETPFLMKLFDAGLLVEGDQGGERLLLLTDQAIDLLAMEAGPADRIVIRDRVKKPTPNIPPSIHDANEAHPLRACPDREVGPCPVRHAG